MSFGAFAGFQYDVFALDLLGRNNPNAVRLFYRAAGAANALQLEFTDNDSTDPAHCDKLIYKQNVTPDDSWHELIVPFDSFQTFTDGSGFFNMDAATYLNYGLTRDNGANTAGSVLMVDNIQTYNTASYTSIVDDFERSTTINTRFAGVFAGPDQVSGSLTYTNTPSQVHGGTYAAQLTYAGGGSGFYFMAEDLHGAPMKGNENIEFWARSLSGSPSLQVRVQDWKGQQETTPVFVSPALTTSYQHYSLPLSGFTGIDTSRLNQIVFVLGGASTVFIDDVVITGASSSPVGQAGILEDFSISPLSLTNYNAFAHPAATINFDLAADASVPGAVDGNLVGRINYTFHASTDVPYAVVQKPFALNLFAEPVLHIPYIGTGGNNTLEIQLVDLDGTVYTRKLPGISNTGGQWPHDFHSRFGFRILLSGI